MARVPAARARKSLQVAISRARRVLDPPVRITASSRAPSGLPAVSGERDEVDAEVFRARRRWRCRVWKPTKALLEHGPLALAGEPLPEERYSDWAASYRERLIEAATRRCWRLWSSFTRTRETRRRRRDRSRAGRPRPLNERPPGADHAYARSGRTGYPAASTWSAAGRGSRAGRRAGGGTRVCSASPRRRALLVPCDRGPISGRT